MKSGELRRFKAARLMVSDWSSPEEAKVAGQTFMVIALYAPYHNSEDSTAYVDFLVEGMIEIGWGSRWVERNSEVLDGVE